MVHNIKVIISLYREYKINNRECNKYTRLMKEENMCCKINSRSLYLHKVHNYDQHITCAHSVEF